MHLLSPCFLAVDDFERIVFADPLVGGWRLAEQPFMTAVVTFADHPNGTNDAAHVMHKTNADRNMREKVGFYDGWGAGVEQLAAPAERRA